MRLGIMQPYFAPALAYFDLINISDEWVVFDTAQYRRKSWMNRNRIRHPVEGSQYITARVAKHSRSTPIREIELSQSPGWRELIRNQFGHYKDAPNYRETIALLDECLTAGDTRLCELSLRLLAAVCERLEINFAPQRFSEMELKLGPISGPGDWALRISEALGADEYINPPGGEGLFDRDAFAELRINLRIRRFREPTMPLADRPFIPMLSVIDSLMWCDVDELRRHLAEERATFLRLSR